MLSLWPSLVNIDCLGVLGVSGRLRSLPCEMEGFTNQWSTRYQDDRRKRMLEVVVTVSPSSLVFRYHAMAANKATCYP